MQSVVATTTAFARAIEGGQGSVGGEGFEVLEAGFDGRIGKPERAQPRRTVDRLSLPAGVAFEVPDRGGDRRPVAVVENEESSRSHELAQEREIDEHVVEDVAAVDEGSIRHEAFDHEPRQREL